MHLDAVDLKDFYACPLGLVVRRLLGARIRGALWRPQSLPHLRARLRHALSRCLQGRGRAVGRADAGEPRRHFLAREGPSLSVLVEEAELPLIDEGADRILLVHMLEWSEKPLELLRELWRVLAPNGRLLLIVPNRRGLVGASRHHAVRLWQPVQPQPAHAAAEGGHVLAGGMGIRALYAALQLAHPAQMAAVLGAPGARAMADLLRRDHGRGDQAGLCRGAGARDAARCAAASSPSPPASPRASSATAGTPPARRTNSARRAAWRRRASGHRR